MLESIIKMEVDYKTFDRSESLFFGKNVLHVHHSQSFYIEDNHIRYFKHKYKTEKSVIARMNESLQTKPDCNPEYEIVYETLMESMTWDKKTGEWILFQKTGDQYYFIALALHDSEDIEDKQLFGEIQDYIR